MKKSNFILLVTACVLLFALACEKEIITENEVAEPDNELLKSLADDSSLAIPSDISVTDTVLLDHASVSQCREQFLAYSYDRFNRLDLISYISRNAYDTNPVNDYYPGFVHMHDKFIYGNDGRLSRLIRYRLSEKPRICRLDATKIFKYNNLGQLVEIITRRADLTNLWNKTEYLSYDERGNMVKRLIKTAGFHSSFYEYEYDRSDRLKKITAYTIVNAVEASDNANRVLKFICDVHYDELNNIVRKDFYYPLPYAASITDVTRKWSIYYRHDKGHNPFFDMKLPVSSLFDWMDVISPSNITAISMDNGTINRSVFYSYRYNNLLYPVLRYRVSPLPVNE